ncbi:hypothetical protein LCGC14_2257590 [marine sediment metagenome]|uniref:Glutamine cyclotransferase n=1 Tax=marine sediment metagenome TaxID=412755 RepID=A0A0F9D104_9ZZZZ
MPRTMNRNGPTKDLVFLSNGYVREHGIHLALGVILIVAVLLGGTLVVDIHAQRAPASSNLVVERDEPQNTYFPVTFSSPHYYTYRVVNSFPHDPEALTQGLVFDNGTLFEGTGLYGKSTLRQVELETGAVLRSLSLASQYFGEGITIYKDQVVQLSWRSNTGFLYDKDSFELLQTFSYPTEGWGITHDGVRLIVSDGTSTLYFWDPVTFEEIGRIEVHDEDAPVSRLNELEYVRGEVFANVYYTDRIARINPHTGKVTGWINLKGLLDSEEGLESAGVLNGIAYDAENDRLFVTGKRWPKLFEIRLIAWEE